MCHHHFILSSKIINGWSLARCKRCLSRDAFNIDYRLDSKGIAVSPSSKEKRQFLRSQGVPLTNKYWTDADRNEIISSVSTIGINATARKYEIPKSTVGLWAKGLSPNVFNRYKYTNLFKKTVALYAKTINNNRRTAKMFEVPRSSVQVWRKQFFGYD